MAALGWVLCGVSLGKALGAGSLASVQLEVRALLTSHTSPAEVSASFGETLVL